MAAKVIAFVNMKGGVAKTTTTVGVATILSSVHHKKVLVIDLDPQANATFMLIGEEAWTNINLENKTLYKLFDDSLQGRRTDVSEILLHEVSQIGDVKSLDLLPSDTRLIDMDYNIVMESQNSSLLGVSMVDFLRHNIEHLLPDYDYVLIDCPPNLGLITLNGMKITNGYVIPTIPDILSTWGIINVMKRIGDFSMASDHEISFLGLVYTKVRGQFSLHQRIMKELPWKEAYRGIPIFETIFSESAVVATAADFAAVTSAKKKWGSKEHYECLLSFTQELMERLGE